MKQMYNQSTNEIETLPNALEVGGVNKYTSKMSEAELNAEGWYNVTYGPKTDSRYYINTEVKALVGNVYEVTYTQTDRDLATVTEEAQDRTDNSCKSFIYDAWSAERQANVAMGLYEENICALCKDEIGSTLSDNVGFVDDIALLLTVLEIEAYEANMTRTAIGVI